MDELIRNPQLDSVELMNLYGQEVKQCPGIPSREILMLRARLNFEETLEFVKACGCEVTLCGDGSVLDKDTMQVFIDESIEPDLVEMVDAIGDTQVVNLGAACALGVDVQPVWDEIQRSNLSKVFPDGTVHKREDGKVLKPDTYSPADIKSVLAKQTEEYIFHFAKRLVEIINETSAEFIGSLPDARFEDAA